MTREGLLKQIQRKNEPYRRIKELEKENAELKEKLDFITKNAEPAGRALVDMVKREVEKAEQGKENN